MKKNIFRLISVLLLSLIFFQCAFALDEETQKSYAAETIGRVPKQFQRMVNSNWAVASGEFSEDGYYHFNAEDGKVEIEKYNIYGKKQYTTEYDYKYAGKNKNGFLNFRYHNASVKLINNNGDTFFASRVLRSIPLLKIDLPSHHNLVKVDPKGNVVWAKTFKSKDVYLIRGMVEADDGSLILGVTKQTKWFSAGANDYEVSLMKLSADGEIIKQVDLREGITLIDNLVYVDGQGFMGMTMEIIGEDDDYEKKNYLNAFDNELNLLWEYEIDSTFYPWDKENVSENGYPIKEKKKVDTKLYQTKKQTLIRLDFDKNVVSKKTFETKTENEYISNIFFLNNGDYVVEYGSDSSYLYEEQACYVRYSKGFRNLGELKLPGYGIHNIIETKNERIFCCWNALSYYEGGGVDDRECVYTAFDKDWNLLWQKGTKENSMF